MEERNVAPTIGGGKKAPDGTGLTRGGNATSIAPTIASR
jgi:hypothetical protein